MRQNHRRRTGVFPVDRPSPRRVVAAHPATVYGVTEGVRFLSFRRRSPPNGARRVPISDVSRLIILMYAILFPERFSHLIPV
jgi:hypothetical protein